MGAGEEGDDGALQLPPPLPGSCMWPALLPGRRRCCLAAGAARFPNVLQLGWLGPSPSYRGVVLGPRGSGS